MTDQIRQEFERQAKELCVTLDKLRKGTGGYIEFLMMQCWDKGYAAGRSAGLEEAAQMGDVARRRIGSSPRKAILTAEEGYDAAMVDYSDNIRAAILKQKEGK